MNVFQKIPLLLLASATLLTACQQEVDLGDSHDPTVVASQTETLTSRGYDMTVDLSANNIATVTTNSANSPALASDPMVMFASNVTGIGLSGEIYSTTNAAGEAVDYEMLNSPTDNRTYWAVPFNSAQEPIKIAEAGIIIIIIGASDCICGNGGTGGCYNSGLGCGSTACASCGRDIIIIIIDTMVAMHSGMDSPYTIVAAEKVDYNGVTYY
jgi:hypothetical protein